MTRDYEIFATMKIEISLYYGSWNYQCLWTLVVYISRVSNRHASATSRLCSDAPFISLLSASTLSFLGLSTLLVTHFHHSNVYVGGADINRMRMTSSIMIVFASILLQRPVLYCLYFIEQSLLSVRYLSSLPQFSC